MNRFRERKTWIVLIAVLLLFAACKGESPTAPPPGGGIPPGGQTPPTGVNLTLTVSNANPLVDSTVTITATVTNNGQPVPNGTAVEFSSTGGVLNGDGTATIKTTTGGVATVTLTSGATGLIRVTATVNNVTQTRDVTFVARPVTPPPPNTAPTISSVSPTVGRPQGGELIRITGTNFKAPVRVLFNTGGATAIEGSVQSVSDTVIEVVTPPVNISASQQLIADIIVLTQAGTATEQRVELSDSFTFRNQILQPIISTVTPNSGPVTGGTRVTIFGDGFQEPVQVLFGTAEARVLNVAFDRINVETPAGRDTSPGGSDVVTGPVSITVRNINSQTTTSMSDGFHYKAAMAIIAAGPGGGTTAGGVRVTIDGIGFVAPVAVVIRTGEGDIGLTPVFVSGTRIEAITPAIIVDDCSTNLQGPIVVTNIANGDQAEGPIFEIGILQPAIVNINPTEVTIGVPPTSIQVTVANAIPGVTRFRLGDRTVFPSGTTVDGTTVTFTLPVPTNFTFPTETCGTGGTRRLPVIVDVVYSPAASGCEDTVEQALTINPADSSCVLPPPAEVTQLVPVPPSCADAGSVVAVGTAVGTATITFRNDGGQTLLISRGAITGPQAANFTVAPASASIEPGQNGSFNVTFDPTAAGAASASVNFTTNDADEGSINVCLTGNGT